MKITFLGTGTSQGVPVIACTCDVCKSLDYKDKRLRTSIHIQIGDKSFVVDTGPDFRQQMIRERINKLDAVLFTHEHKDHTAGLDDVRAFNFKQKKDMPIYAKDHVIDQLKREFSYAFSGKKYPGVPQISVNYIENQPFEIEGVTITPIEVMHLHLPVFGFRIGDFTYITDANYISDKEMNKIKGSKTLVLNALQVENHISHFNLDQAIKIVQQIAPEISYFTHISHKMGRHSTVEKRLPEGIHLAYDGQTIDM